MPNVEGRRNDDIRMANLCESAELFLLSVLSASSVVKSRGCFAEGAAATDAKRRPGFQTRIRAACTPQICVIRVIRGCLFLFHLRVYSCPFVVLFRKFSLNPVEGIK